MLTGYPRSLRRWLLAIALIHWLVVIILLLSSLKRQTAHNRAPARPAPVRAIVETMVP